MNTRKTIQASAAFILLCIVPVLSSQKDYMRVSYIFWAQTSSSYGDSILLELPGADGDLGTPDDKYALIDGGGPDNTGVQNFLSERDINHIDYMVISHNHGDHYGGLVTLANSGWSVDYVYESGNFNRVQGDVGNYSDVSPGDILSGPDTTKGPGWDPNVEVKALWGAPGGGNNDSMVLKVSLGSSTFIFGGDLESNESNLNASDLSDIEIYKVNHHGSDTSSSSSFLSNMNLQYAIQQDAGGSSHPYAEALTRIRDAGGIIYRNDLDGHVVIRCDSEGNYEITRETFYPNKNPSGSWQAPPPELPSGLAVTGKGKYYIDLEWDDTLLDESGGSISSVYHVFRATVSGGDEGAGTARQPGMEAGQETGIYRRLTDSPVSGTSFTDNSIKEDKIYYYRISAVRTDYNYERRYSNEASTHTFFDPPGRIADLSALRGPADREIKLTWTAPGETGYSGDNRAGAEYIVKYATYAAAGSTAAVAAWWENAELYEQDWEVGPQGTDEEKITTGFSFGTTYYFALKTADAFGNVSVISSTPTPGAVPQVDVTSPTVAAGEITPQPESRAVAPSDTIEVTFSEGMSTSTVKEALILHKIKDNFSRLLDAESVGFSFIEVSSSVYRLAPDVSFEKGFTYSVTVTTAAMDLATITHPGDRQHSMETDYSWNFTVLMDKDKRNRAAAADGAWAEFSPGTFSDDYRVEISEPQNRADINRANRNIASRDPGSAPLAVREFKIYGAGGGLLNSSFSGRAQINIPYDYDDKYEQATAAIWRLDDESEMWVRIPEAEKSAGSLSASVYHFSVFGVLAQSATDLGDAFAYPVPYKPNDGRAESGTPGEGIKFKNLSSRAKIKIYTLSGEHVRTLDYEYGRDGEPFGWDTRDSEGTEVPSGLYFYRIYNDDDEITGRLVIVR